MDFLIAAEMDEVENPMKALNILISKDVPFQYDDKILATDTTFYGSQLDRLNFFSRHNQHQHSFSLVDADVFPKCQDKTAIKTAPLSTTMATRNISTALPSSPATTTPCEISTPTHNVLSSPSETEIKMPVSKIDDKPQRVLSDINQNLYFDLEIRPSALEVEDVIISSLRTSSRRGNIIDETRSPRFASSTAGGAKKKALEKESHTSTAKKPFKKNKTNKSQQQQHHVTNETEESSSSRSEQSVTSPYNARRTKIPSGRSPGAEVSRQLQADKSRTVMSAAVHDKKSPKVPAKANRRDRKPGCLTELGRAKNE